MVNLTNWNLSMLFFVLSLVCDDLWIVLPKADSGSTWALKTISRNNSEIKEVVLANGIYY